MSVFKATDQDDNATRIDVVEVPEGISIQLCELKAPDRYVSVILGPDKIDELISWLSEGRGSPTLGYGALENGINVAPLTYLPALLVAVVKACIKKNVFVDGGLQKVVANASRAASIDTESAPAPKAMPSIGMLQLDEYEDSHFLAHCISAALALTINRPDAAAHSAKEVMVVNFNAERSEKLLGRLIKLRALAGWEPPGSG